MAFPAFWQYFSNLKYLKPKVPPQPKVLPLQKKWCPSKKVPPGETAPFPCSSCYHLILVFSANHSHKNAIVPSHTKNHWLSFLNLFGCLHNLILNYLELKLAKIFSTDDPVDIFGFLDRCPNSLLKFFEDIFSSRSTSGIFFCNDLMVLIDIVLRQVQDLSPGDKVCSSEVTLHTGTKTLL